LTREKKDPETRTKELLLAAEHVFSQTGYDNSTVEAITKEAGVAKGTFYLYFESKDDLLTQLASYRAEQLFKTLHREVGALQASAPRKLAAFHKRSFQWKISTWGMSGDYLHALSRDESISLRYHLNSSFIENLTPLVASIIKQGVDESSFEVKDPELAGEIILILVVGLSERLVPYFTRLKQEPGLATEMMKKIRAVEEAEKRILGIEQPALQLYDINFGKVFLGEGMGEKGN
jgi:AcrR family transcriptional regulator